MNQSSKIINTLPHRFRFEIRLAFFFEKRSQRYQKYLEVSIAEEKADITQKILQCGQLCWTAGRIGLQL